MRVVLAVLLALLPGCAEARPAIEGYTYRIVTRDGGLCSATAVARNVILTARHCLSPGDGYLILAGSRIAIVRVDADARDHVLVTLQHAFEGWAGRGATPKAGDTIRMYGNVDGFDQLFRLGYMSGWNGDSLVFTLNCGRGDSGAGLFDDQGQLVGVVSAVYNGPLAKFCIAYPLAFSPKQLELIR